MNELIFVYGALRSGTTLLKLMLDSHEDINCPGEVDFIFDYLKKATRSDDWFYDLDGLALDFVYQDFNLDVNKSDDARSVARYFVDQFRQRAEGKLILFIHRNLDKAIELFSDAKFIHLTRDPRDVARSCVEMGWAGIPYFGVEQWLKTEQDWDRLSPLLDKRSTIELSYEQLISNPEEQLERVCIFLSVPYSSSMLDYPSRSTYKAPDRRAIAQWKRKLTPRESALVEIRVAHLLRVRHYELSGYPLNPPSFQERIWLIWKDRTYKWKFGFRRYGLLNVIMVKLTRKLPRAFHAAFVQRKNGIARRYLK